MRSALYEGRVRHRRFAPTTHAFRYTLSMAYLDLAELDEVFRGRLFWSARRPNLSYLRRRDHLGDPSLPLETTVRDLVEREAGFRPEGPIGLLAHLRTFGACMNPVSFLYCWDRAGERVEAVIAEVSNTPWGERHPYVLDARGSGRHVSRFDLRKRFHVSPFLPMEVDYVWRVTRPGRRLAVHIECREAGRKTMDATMTLARRPISGGSLARALLGFPPMTMKVFAAIYWEAFRLFLKRTPFHTHPKYRVASS